MFVEYIKEGKNQMGKPIPVGTQIHILNEAAHELIAEGMVKAVNDPEDYSSLPTIDEETSPENRTDKNKSGRKSNKRRKRP